MSAPFIENREELNRLTLESKLDKDYEQEVKKNNENIRLNITPLVPTFRTREQTMLDMTRQKQILKIHLLTVMTPNQAGIFLGKAPDNYVLLTNQYWDELEDDLTTKGKNIVNSVYLMNYLKQWFLTKERLVNIDNVIDPPSYDQTIGETNLLSKSLQPETNWTDNQWKIAIRRIYKKLYDKYIDVESGESDQHILDFYKKNKIIGKDVKSLTKEVCKTIYNFETDVYKPSLSPNVPYATLSTLPLKLGMKPTARQTTTPSGKQPRATFTGIEGATGAPPPAQPQLPANTYPGSEVSEVPRDEQPTQPVRARSLADAIGDTIRSAVPSALDLLHIMEGERRRQQARQDQVAINAIQERVGPSIVAYETVEPSAPPSPQSSPVITPRMDEPPVDVFEQKFDSEAQTASGYLQQEEARKHRQQIELAIREATRREEQEDDVRTIELESRTAQNEARILRTAIARLGREQRERRRPDQQIQREMTALHNQLAQIERQNRVGLTERTSVNIGRRGRRGRGTMVQKHNCSIKVGSGISLDETSREKPYYEFGRYVIHIPSLKKQVLNLKYPSLSTISTIPKRDISSNLTAFFLDMVENSKVNKTLYDGLHDEDKKIFHHLTEQAEVCETLGFGMKIIGDKDDYDKFLLLKGELIAGNNSPQVLKELKTYVLRYMSEGRLNRRDGFSILADIAILV